MIKALIAITLLACSGVPAHAEVCDKLLYELGFTPDLLAVVGVSVAEFALITSELTDHAADRQILTARRDAVAATKESLKDSRAQLALSTEQSRDALRVAFEAARQSHDSAVVAYETARATLTTAVVGSLPSDSATAASQALSPQVAALPMEYRLLQWPPAELVGLAAAIAREKAGAWISASERQLLDSARSSLSYHQAQVRLQANLLGLQQQFAGIACN